MDLPTMRLDMLPSPALPTFYAPVGTSPNPLLPKVLAALEAPQAGYALLRRYYNGQHDTAWIADTFDSVFMQHFRQRYSKNFCARVVDATRDRLALTGFTDRGDTDTGAADAAWEIWQANRMDVGQDQIYADALLMGDAYLIVWRDPLTGDVTLDPQLPEQMAVGYDPESPRRLLWGAKCWIQEDGRWRLTLYLPDRIEKYITTVKPTAGVWPKATAFVEYAPPIPNPTGQVPVFHFANNARSGQPGVSDLNDVIPLQDDLNKTAIDRLTASEVQALPQRTIAGWTPKILPDGSYENPFKNKPGALWWLEDKDAKFGEFTAANLEQFIKVEAETKADIARVSGTPMHYLLEDSGWPSGDAMETAEAPFVAKIENRQKRFGNVFEDALMFALRLTERLAGQLESKWRPAVLRSQAVILADAVTKQALGIPQAQIWRELNYTDEQIAEMQQMDAAQTQAQVARIRQEQLLALQDVTNGPIP